MSGRPKIDSGYKLEEIIKAIRSLENKDLDERRRREIWRILHEDLEEYLPLLIHIAEYSTALVDTPISSDGCFADEIMMLTKQVELLRIWSKQP